MSPRRLARSVVARSPRLGRAVTTARKVGLTAEATTTLVWAQLAIRRLPAGRVTGLLGVTAPVPAVDPVVGTAPGRRGAALRRARAIGRVVDASAQRLPRSPTCLPRAVTTACMLRRRGVTCRAHLGVVSRSPLLAHAWVTVDGVVVVGGATTDITELAAFTGGEAICQPGE